MERAISNIVKINILFHSLTQAINKDTVIVEVYIFGG
jgi:hypothetical protein